MTMFWGKRTITWDPCIKCYYQRYRVVDYTNPLEVILECIACTNQIKVKL